MKKIFLLLTVVLAALLLPSCNENDDITLVKIKCTHHCEVCGKCTVPVCRAEGGEEKCEGHHFCESVCAECGKCLDATCTDSACTHKCEGHHHCENMCYDCNKCRNTECREEECAAKCEGHSEAPVTFNGGDYITDSDVSIDYGTFVLDTTGNAYIRGDLAIIMGDIAAAMEKVSGVDFDGAGYANWYYEDGKVHVNAPRNPPPDGQPSYSEGGTAYASSSGYVMIVPADLALCNSYAIIHELGHVLMFRQSEWSHCKALNEGFAEYTTYRALEELAKKNPAYQVWLSNPHYCVTNMVGDEDKLYEHPIEYWFSNTFEYAGNKDYAVGFRLMWYLDDVYGDYGKWVTEFEKLYCFREAGPGSDVSPVEWQIAALKSAYGEDVLDGFYPWLKENIDLFEVDFDNKYGESDLSGIDKINLYPAFSIVTPDAVMHNFKYNDLYINIETVRGYLSEYKELDVSKLSLKAEGDKAPVVNLYDAQGNYISISLDKPVSLEGVSYIKLVGEGTLRSLEITGFLPDDGQS